MYGTSGFAGQDSDWLYHATGTGIAFTTSIRDFYNSDYLSGVIHLLDALLTALFISVGVGLTIYIFQSLGGVMS